jgi:hypothetical protein
MHSWRASPIMALTLGGCFILAAPPAAFAQISQQQHEKSAPAGTDQRGRRTAPREVAPREVAPREAAPRKVAPREVAPREVAPRKVAPRKVAPREVAPREVAPRKIAPREVAPREVAPREVAPRKIAPREVAPREVAPRKITPRTGSERGLRSLPTRGASRTAIHGRSFTAWRSGYRIRRGSGWRTFGALSALNAIVIGSITYYPYAYILAPEPYCDDLTEDGCELMWLEVMTLEGDLEYQCVAYCPWE